MRLRPRSEGEPRRRRPTARLLFPRLGVFAGPTQVGGGLVATLPFPGLAMGLGVSVAPIAFPGLGIVATPGARATPLLFPGLAVAAPLRSTSPFVPAADLRMPALSLPVAQLGFARPTFDLTPDHARDWKPIKATAGAGIAQIGTAPTGGVTLTGGPANAAQTDNLIIVSRNKSRGGWTLAGTIRLRDNTLAQTNDDRGLLFYAGLVGDASSAVYPRDVSQWAANFEPHTHEFRDHCKGMRLSFFFQSVANGNSHTVVPTLAVFNNGTTTVVAQSSGPASVQQVAGVDYGITLGLSGTTLTLVHTDPSPGGLVDTITWTDPALGVSPGGNAQIPDGSFGWLVTDARVADVKNSRIVPNLTGPVPGAFVPPPGLGVAATVDSIILNPSGFVNGYAARTRLVAAAQADLPPEPGGDVLVDFPLALTGMLGFLNQSGAGAIVTSALGRDIRFEVGGENPTGLGGVKLSHILFGYTPAGGPAGVRLRLPSWACRTADYPLFVYYGKAGLAASEEDPAGVFASAQSARRLDTGVDLNGNAGRDLALTRVTAGTLTNGLPGGVFGQGVVGRGLPGDDASYASRENPSDLGDLTELTFELLASFTGNPDANVYRVGGRDGSDAQVNLWTNDPQSTAGFDTTTRHAYDIGWRPFSGSPLVGHNTFGRAPADTVTTGLHILHAAFRTGLDPQLYIDGAAQSFTPLNATVQPSGKLVIASTHNESVGAGTGSNPNAIPGAYHLAIVYARKLSATWIAVAARCQLDSASVVGVGVTDLSGAAVEAPVAEPLRLTIPSGSSDQDLAALAVDSQTPRTVALDSVTAVPGCSASIVAGLARLSPSGALGSTVQIPYRVAKGAKTSSSKVYATVGGVVAAALELRTDPGGTPSTRVFRVPEDYPSVQAAIDGAGGGLRAGDEINVADGQMVGNITINVSGTKGNEILVRSRGDPRRFAFGTPPSVSCNGLMTLGGQSIQVFGFDYVLASAGVTMQGADCIVTRFRLAANGPQIAGRARRCLVGYGEQMGNTQGNTPIEFYVDLGLTTKFTAVCQDSRQVAVYYHDISNSLANKGEGCRVGSAPRHDIPYPPPMGPKGIGVIFERILVERVAYLGSSPNDEVLSFKCSGADMRDICVSNPAGMTTGGKANVQIRHGEGCTFDGIYTEGPGTGVTSRGYGNRLMGVECRDGGKLVVKGGNYTTAQWRADVAAAISSPGNYVISENTVVVAPIGPVQGGGGEIGTRIYGSQQATGVPAGWTVDNVNIPPHRTARRLNHTTHTGVQADFTPWPT